jgi:hypothetical protein
MARFRIVSPLESPFVRGSSAILAALAAATLACGGSSGPSAPTTVPSPPATGLAAGTAISLVSGENGQPVAGAAVTVAGRAYASDGSGQVLLADAVAWGGLVDVVAPGFLDRQTVVRRNGATRVVLWPLVRGLGFDDAYVAELVYTAGTREPPPLGRSPLRRIRAGTTQAFVLLTPELWADEAARGAHETAVSLLSAASGARLVYAAGTTRPTSGVVFEAKVDPGDPLCGDRTRAFTQATVSGNEITGGRVVYCSLDAARTSTVQHELGHTFGLQHSPHWRELMSGVFQGGRANEFGPRESLAMAMQLERLAGNRFPDSDRDVTASAGSITTIVCR